MTWATTVCITSLKIPPCTWQLTRVSRKPSALEILSVPFRGEKWYTVLWSKVYQWVCSNNQGANLQRERKPPPWSAPSAPTERGIDYIQRNCFSSFVILMMSVANCDKTVVHRLNSSYPCNNKLVAAQMATTDGGLSCVANTLWIKLTKLFRV